MTIYIDKHTGSLAILMPVPGAQARSGATPSPPLPLAPARRSQRRGLL